MISLKNFKALNQAELEEVLKWRNDKSVARFMKTQNISLKEHLDFVKRLKNDASKAYFVVLKDDESVGVIHLFDITPSSCEFGLYAKPGVKGVGVDLMREIMRYAFENLKVQKLKACVLKTNEKALNLYLKSGFKIVNEDEKMFYVCKTRGGGGVAFR
ncbi:UDP-4-amino-4,6-dideoxy-N-acetyl-beta-L-altrosamine N-acetyltransferase [Campylobacter helveticus]|uniref:UDP-4-amino-4, 6-dideoxy-N-acetyl-beta-L-altrosamine N-acetyltransferase n=1 Tax=Campylobacter helveticus TaxID=28898 RepID=UPI0022EB0CEB|nr:UDP-4-amino-4,6-dideoxy-N-acetyl-beta-L-altrosamine N-acetyltransferase [Campylobacter helveticus]